VDDITPDMQSKFVTAIQKMELPVDEVLEKGIFGVSLAPKKLDIFPTPGRRHLVGKQKEIEALRKEAKNFETAEEFMYAEKTLPIAFVTTPVSKEKIISEIGKIESRTPDAPVVVTMRDGRITILDGNQRYYQKIDEGAETIKVVFTPENDAMLTAIWERAQGTEMDQLLAAQEVLIKPNTAVQATETEKITLFREGIGRKQRYYSKNDPEKIMKRYQNYAGGGSMAHHMEHLGDLLWRTTHMMPYRHYGINSKVDNGIAWLSITGPEFLPLNATNFNYKASDIIKTDDIPDPRKAYAGFLNNIDSNIREFRKEGSVPPTLEGAKKIIKEYGEAHAKLPVYNKVQWLMREVPVALGKFDYVKVKALLEMIRDYPKDTFWKDFESIIKDKNGKAIEYKPPKDSAISKDTPNLAENIKYGEMYYDKFVNRRSKNYYRELSAAEKNSLGISEELVGNKGTNKQKGEQVKETDAYMDDLVLTKTKDGELALVDKNIARNVDKGLHYIVGSEITVVPKLNYWTGKDSTTNYMVGTSGIPDKFKGKKLGKRLYLKMMDEIIKKGGESLGSDIPSVSATRVWKGLIKTSDQDLIALGFPQLAGVLTVEAPAFELAVQEAGIRHEMSELQWHESALNPNSKNYDPYESNEIGADMEIFAKHIEPNGTYSLEGMIVEEDAVIFEVFFNTRRYKENIAELNKRREGGEDIKQYRRGGLVTKKTYRRGGLVSHNGYRKNMSRLGFQEGGYAR